MKIIEFSNQKEQNQTISNPRFTRPMPIQIKSEGYVDETPVKKKSAAEPIKNISDIWRVSDYFISHKQYRNNLIFVMGINFGLRCGDLLGLKVGSILNPDGSFKSEVCILEEKTKKIRTCYMNNGVMDAAELYLRSLGREIALSDFLFTSLSNNNSKAYYDTLKANDLKVKREEGSSISVHSVERILKETINKKLGINVHAGTHLMRKTFAYHVIMNASDRTRAIELLQKILGHSSASITLAYAGITDDEIKATYHNLDSVYRGMDFCYAAGIKNIG